MSRSINFFAPGDPKGQPRARAVMRGKRAGVYDPGTADAWKHAVADAWRAYVAPENAPQFRPYETAVRVTLQFFMRRPKGHFRNFARMNPALSNSPPLKASAPLRHTQKPDVDNLAKAVLDVLTRLGAWTDDCLVASLIVSRNWAQSSPGCSIEIIEIDDLKQR